MENYSQVWTRMTRTASRGKLLCKTGGASHTLIGEPKAALLETCILYSGIFLDFDREFFHFSYRRGFRGGWWQKGGIRACSSRVTGVIRSEVPLNTLAQEC